MKGNLFLLLGAILLFISIAEIADATQIDLLFDVKLDRIYSYDGTQPTGPTIGDTSTLKISFNNDIAYTRTSLNPWGVDTSILITRLDGAVDVESPYTQFVPANPIANPVDRSFYAEGRTIYQGNNDIWYEDLWFTNQYSQFSDDDTDGIDVYRYKFNVHWDMTRFDYTPDKLYFFDEQEVINVLQRSIDDGVTFSISEDAYIDFSDGSYFGYDIDGTATLRGYNIINPVPEPSTILLLGSGLLGLGWYGRKRKEK